MTLPLFIVAALVLTVAGSASAQSASRHALLIGANQGLPGEPPLQFALDDAERMAQVLEDQGGFLPETITILRQPSAERVRSTLAALNARIRNDRPGADSVLLVFYSGHADEQAIHLGPAPLPWSELRDLTVGSSATTRLLIVDACRSGVATRVKGIALDEPFALPSELGDLPDGFAILSSAAAGESAQESDTIRSSFFTFHLVGGLTGLADRDGDGAVTLAEAFDYTSDRTVASTAATMAGIQHPTYRYDLKGKSSFVLTRPASQRRRLVEVRMTAPGVYLWRDGGEEGRLVLEANANHEPRVAWLPPGVYFVQRRGDDRLYQGTISLAPGHRLDTASLKLRAIEYDQLVRKGGRTGAHLLGARVGQSAAWIEGYAPGAVLGLHVAYAHAAATFDLGIETSHAGIALPGIEGSLRSYGAFGGVVKLFDLGAATVGTGLRVGATRVAQAFETSRTAPARAQILPTASMLATTSFTLPWALYLAAEGGLTVTTFETADQGVNVRRQTRVLPWACLELGRRF